MRWLALLLLAGCGATYQFSRTSPDGSTVSASAYTMEATESIEFYLVVDPETGVQRVKLMKTGATPSVTINGDTLRALLAPVAP